MIRSAVPALVGSPKQVDWAEKIRTAKLGQWESRVAASERRAVDTAELLADPHERLWIDLVRPIEEAWLDKHVWSQTSAKWWIENRDVNVLDRATLATRDQSRAIRQEFKAARDPRYCYKHELSGSEP